MELNKEPSASGTGLPLARKKVTIKDTDKCPLCKEVFMDDQKKLIKPIMDAELVGVVHEGCYLPFHPNEVMSILIQIRCYSIGDTIAVTPVIREYKRLYPHTNLSVMTFFPEIFIHNPYISTIIDLGKPVPKEMIEGFYFRVDAFDTERAHHFAMHSVEYSSLCALNRSLLPHSWQYEVWNNPEEIESAKKILQENGIDIEKDRCILMHPHGTEWKTRDWGRYNFAELTRKIKAKYPDMKLVSIGGKRAEVKDRVMKNFVEIDCDADLYGKLTLLETIAMMRFPCMKLLVTPDTGTLHMGATAPELPIVGIFTLIKAFLRTPTRNGRMSYKFIGVEADNGCNCTYNSRHLTHEMRFDTCPKQTFFKTVYSTNLPKFLKYRGLKQFDPAVPWEEKKMQSQLKEQIAIHADNRLPCFPTQDKVMRAIDKALNEWSN